MPWGREMTQLGMAMNESSNVKSKVANFNAKAIDHKYNVPAILTQVIANACRTEAVPWHLPLHVHPPHPISASPLAPSIRHVPPPADVHAVAPFFNGLRADVPGVCRSNNVGNSAWATPGTSPCGLAVGAAANDVEGSSGGNGVVAEPAATKSTATALPHLPLRADEIVDVVA
jgi:hypothetical protein